MGRDSPRRSFHLIAVLLAVYGVDPSLAAQAPPILFTGVHVVPMDGERVIRDVAVLIRGGRVDAIGSAGAIAAPAGVTRVDARGGYMIPGLWDMHLHFFGTREAERELRVILANGVTSARVLAGAPAHLEWRRRIDGGEWIGPDLYLAGPILEGEPPPELSGVITTEGKIVVHDSADAAAEVRRQHGAGYDFIKVYNNVPAHAYRGVTTEARRLGIPVAGHVPFAVGLEKVLAARQASIEHLRGYVWHLVPEDAARQPGADLRSRSLAWAGADLTRIESLAEATRRAGAWNTPTLAIRMIMKPKRDIEAYLLSEEGRRLPPGQRGFYANRTSISWLSNFSEDDFRATIRGFAVQDSLIRALVGVGARVLAGTDSPPFGFSLHRELRELVAAGLTPYQALEAATRNPGDFFRRLDGTGRITVGSPADLVLLEGNPLRDIDNTRRIRGVVKAGAWYDRAKLSAWLDEAG